MALENALLKILACPIDKGELLYFESEDLLYNPRLRRLYRITDDVPVLLAERSDAVTDEEHGSLMRRSGCRAVRTLGPPVSPS
jgi:uncharacterized protein YbaR (Trm112 family)